MSDTETVVLHYQNQAIPLSIQRSHKRRTVGITIDQGGVRVAAPVRMSRKRVLELVHTKAGWIVEKHLEFQSKIIPPKRFVSGERFSYLGREVVLQVMDGKEERRVETRSEASQQPDLFSFDFVEVVGAVEFKPSKPLARLNGDRLEVWSGSRTVRELVEGWYKLEAERFIVERVQHYAQELGWAMPKVLIRDQKKRWGSCNSKGELRFNWRLMQAEAGIVNYVVVHEMAHLEVLNHSPKYWRLVERIMPDYKRYHDALHQIGAGLYW